jgi:uncharacterized membrane protein YsdA (DUF1294 family)
MSLYRTARAHGIPAYLLVCIGTLVVLRRWPETGIVKAWILCMNPVTFLVFGLDKFFATRNAQRVPEKVLFSLAALGGLVGALLGMLVFRHKTSKRSFQWKLAGILLAEAVVLGVWFTGGLEAVGIPSPF